MSGFEVAGLVLGILPLAIKAVDVYMTLLSSLEGAAETLKWLKMNLETEQAILRDTCEHLLHGIAPFNMIDPMIKHPFGPDWAKYDDQLKVRLWSSWRIFQEQIQQLSEAATDLERKLCLKKNGVIKINSFEKIRSEIKMKTAFTLKKAAYEDILQKIQSSNRRLQQLARPESSIIRSRQRRSQHSAIKLLRGLSHGIFTAMNSAVTCKCEKNHTIGIELDVWNAIILPDDEEDEVAKGFQYNVVMDSADVPTQWNHAKLQPDGTAAARSEQISSAKPIDLCPPNKRRKMVTWGSEVASPRMQKRKSKTSSAVQALVKSTGTASSLLIPPPIHLESISTISNLCQVFHGKGKTISVTECYGHISDQGKRRFRLSPPPSKEPSKFSYTVTLRDLLCGLNDVAKTSLPEFELERKLQLALILASSILYTYDTPWLAQTVTLSDITFLLEPKTTQTREWCQTAYRPFVTKAVPLAGCDVSSSRAADSQRMINTTVLSVGALLIQIITGTVEDALDLPTTMNFQDVRARREIASQLEARVVENGGENYAKAVKWCFDKAIGLANFQNDRFCQEFYEVVVATLKEDLEIIREQTSD